MNVIASSIPGRLRLRHAVLRHSDVLQEAQQIVRAWPEIWNVDVNAKSGSLVVLYPPDPALQPNYEKLGVELMARFTNLSTNTNAYGLEQAPKNHPSQDRVNTSNSSEKEKVSHKSAAARGKQINRVAKRTMMASLAASMLAAAVGTKKMHIWTGLIFMHALGAHLWFYRRTLLK